MKAFSLSLKGLRRDLRAADVRALFVALMLAVAASTMIGFFLDRLDRGLTRQAGQLMGGDLVLEQSDPFTKELRQTLRDAGLTLSQQVDLVSMASRDNAFQPVSLKVVDPAYPLYGQVRVERGDGTETLAHGPDPGSVWVAPRLARLMGFEIGDTLRIGESTFTVSGLVEREPDQSAGFSAFNPRVMMHRDDLPATGLVQPGSRLEYELLAKGPPDAVARVQSRLDRLRDNGVEVRDVREDRPRLGGALDRAQRYLSLSGLAAVLLAGVAVAMATRRYVDRHLDTAALLRCFGASQRQLSTLFSLQLMWLAVAASVAGALLGLAGQAGLLAILTRFLPLELPPPGPLPLLMGVFTALAILVGFAGPMLLRLKCVSALKVLRRELDPMPVSGWVVIGVASLVFGALLWLYSGDFMLSLGLLVGGELALALLWALGHVLLTALLWLVRGAAGDDRHGARHAWRLGARQLARRRQASLGQLLAFSVTFAAMAIIALVRGDLVSAWEAQLPENTPNYFAINIQPDERDGFREIVENASDTRSDLYPIVRGRLVTINDQPAEATVSADQEAPDELRRALNLTWRATLPAGNRIVAGEWFDADAPAGDDRPVPISMEQGLAERLDVSLGDVLGFDIGSEHVSGRVTSLRSLDWESFRPNFFVIFPPGALERFSHSYITSFHLENDRQATIGKLVSRYPSVSLLNVDAILEQVRELLAQVTRAIELVLVFVLLAGVSVLYAALTASRPMRAHEGALLRVFGAGDRMIARIQGAEFALLGIASGLLGALLAEAAALGVYLVWFDLPPRLHWPLWIVLPVGGALLIGGIGHLLTRSVRRQAPMESLRLLGET
ncbi:putative ABC transport system permease protein [Chromohalobacter marismortui]|uniref:Putative ABC transport system permease protein n=1 Tax=Chromohalobacter marismortui TaxID=42055 RepID=A0A4R7NCZ8_9GAMM|nr:FtsX-like permease family protein [Chromohalobacter marismortui]TDU18107.1 putative ABC transport system permease protein [Chromohalobacter marismortui]